MNIDTEKGTIEVKSWHENYVLEASGIKPYTHRVVTMAEADMLRSLEVSIREEGRAATIVVTDADSKLDQPASVRRQVTNINFAGLRYGHDEATISWRHVPMEEPATFSSNS
ncbi:MAG: hypothetical protein V1897_19845 [Pseudomonadota bacterium]